MEREKGWQYSFDSINFGDRILAQDDYDRFLVLTAREGEDLDNGLCSVDFYDEDENRLDDVEITRWLLLSDILPKEG